MKRYIKVQAVKLKDNTIVPIWDERLIFEKTELFGDRVTIDHDHYYDLVSCIFDLKTKKLSMGIELDVYPDKTEFIVDEFVYVERDYKTLFESQIKKIVYEEFDLRIVKGKNMESWMKPNNIEIDPKMIYAIKNWKPWYILENGATVKSDYPLKHKV